ncbi:MAG TPA: class I SAM-dependent methyltransferase [Thermoanaerobaculia bacterium]|nr:class I SAM-dependent methyltransferase [Thermoanaerobaculia bacterium]
MTAAVAARAAVSFDAQAADFDLRAGLPVEVARRVATVVAGLAPPGPGLFLDLGAGTGQVGVHLAPEPVSGGRARYVGLDLSAGMLAVFRRKLGGVPGEGGVLVRADAGQRWPVADGSARLVFLSRAAHLLPPEVLVDEALRVASPAGAVVVLGCARSPRDGLRAELRRRMRQLLAEHGGVEPRRAGAAQGKIAGALAARGGEVLPETTAASWRVVHRARDAVAGWRAKPGLGGRTLAPKVQEEVLRRLEDWIRDKYGSLDVEAEATERYRLAAIRLPKHSEQDKGTR